MIVPAIDSIEEVTGQGILTASGSFNVTPPQISNTYKLPAHDGTGVKIGIISLGGGWLSSDLQLSMNDLGVSVPNVTTVLINGAAGAFSTNDYNASAENTLDIYCLSAMVPRANIVIYIAPNSLTNFDTCVNKAVNDGCDVLSVSWLTNELNGYGDFMKTSLANAEREKVSVFCASGDFGSLSASPGADISAGYPASHPYVVGVGGTLLTFNADQSRNTEEADSRSGGGLSRMFTLPAYQNGLTYKTRNEITKTTSGPFDLTVRGVPDIAAPFRYYPLYYNGSLQRFGGTSASTPVLAGFAARLVGLTGKRQGNLNSVFYANPMSFWDLTRGYDTSYSALGYTVTANWDPVVGLGAPIGTSIYKILKTSVGSTYPQRTYGSRSGTGAVYPRTRSIR